MAQMLVLLALASLLVLTSALPTTQSLHNQRLVDEINAKNAGWTAKVYPRFAEMSETQLRELMGARYRNELPSWSDDQLTVVEPSNHDEPIPESFDAREHWPACKDVIAVIADQSSCGSCWAVSSASVMSDRVCIGTDGKTKTSISAKDVIGCCMLCGRGCQGGWPDVAFQFWKIEGTVTGSSYKLDQGCQPYPFPECAHHTNSSYPACPKKIYDTPICKRSCQPTYSIHNYKEDKYYGKNIVKLSRNVGKIQREIMTNGPVVFTFSVYADFPTYSGGVYKHTTGGPLGGHAVRAVGWGVENDVPYWLIANSWNDAWGLNGYFKIVRGQNECGIENDAVAAIVDTDTMPKQ